MDGDVYTGKETVKYLARVFQIEFSLQLINLLLLRKQEKLLRKQAKFLRKNKNLNVTIEGHADERGTREYNLALGERSCLPPLKTT